MTYTYSQLETLWLDTAKGTKYATQAWAQLMAAIALAESSGDETVINSIDACGLWQIHPSQPNCTNAQANAQMALQKLQTQGLGAWQSYTTGSYTKFLQSGVSPSSLPNTSGSTSGGQTSDSLVGNLLGIPTQITSAFGDLDKFINLLMWLAQPSSWMRIGSFFIAMLLLAFGIYALMHVSSDQPLVKMPNVVPVPI